MSRHSVISPRLVAAIDAGGKSDRAIAKENRVSARTVARVRERRAQAGYEYSRPGKLAGTGEARE